jgi:hypothetical protein
LPIIIICFKIIFCNSKYMQQLKLIRKLSHLFADLYSATPVVKIWARILFFPTLCRSVLQFLVQQQHIGGNTQVCMDEGYIITRNTCMQQPLAQSLIIILCSPVPVLTTVHVRRKRKAIASTRPRNTTNAFY